MGAELIELLDSLKAGGVVAIPTDTVYGLAAIPELTAAVKELFDLKGRSVSKAIPILGSDIDSLRSVAAFDGRAESLADRFWPGPLTLVLPRAEGFDVDLGGPDTKTVAVRVPEHPLTRELLKLSGPLAVTSANRSGEPPASTAAEVRAIFVAVPVLDGGPASGEPSTVVSLLGEMKLLRQGPISLKEIG